MSETKAKEARDHRLKLAREERIKDETGVLAVMAAILSAGPEPYHPEAAVDHAALILDHARKKARVRAESMTDA